MAAAASTTARPAPTIDLLLRLIDTHPTSILASLAAHPHLASAHDAHGYSLLHAAASYNQVSVLRALVRTYGADIEQRDEDGETPLFAAETLDVARCLVEELGADTGARNSEGKTAGEKLGEEEGRGHPVCGYLEARARGVEGGGAGVGDEAGERDAGVEALPELPAGVAVHMGAIQEDDVGAPPDPEIRRRIEALAAREDYQSDAVQRELRELVQDVVTGMGADEEERSVKRRTA